MYEKSDWVPGSHLGRAASVVVVVSSHVLELLFISVFDSHKADSLIGERRTWTI